jgi:hypothetical protein
MGEDKEAMAQYRKTRLKWHEFAVAKHGKSFDQITQEQFAELEKDPTAAGYINLLKAWVGLAGGAVYVQRHLNLWRNF